MNMYPVMGFHRLRKWWLWPYLLTYLRTYLLTSWCRIFFERL